MSTYDLGDVVTLTCEVRDAAGALADAGAITCTITLPDHSTTVATHTHPSTGTYTADYQPTQLGAHLVVWRATGSNAGLFRSTFTVTDGVAVEPLIRPERVAAKGHVTLPTSGTERAALDTAIDDATGTVLGYLRRPHIDNVAPAAQAAIRSVATRVALRMWRNPADTGSESYNDMSHSFTDPRLLTGDEKDSLTPYRSRHRGPIILTPRLPSGDTP